MIYRRMVLFLLFFTLYAICPMDSHSLSVKTHERINEDVALKTMPGFSLDSYLKNSTLFDRGIDELFNSQNVRQWLSEGGRQEDKPSWCVPYLTRSINHFHNPLTDNGFSGYVNGWFFSGDSALRWAQYPVGTQSSIWCGDFSWFDVRDYFYGGLTSTNVIARENLFSKGFRGVGQLMHLVQDMSVPEHARDQAHFLEEAYEEWVEKYLKEPVYDNAKNNPLYPSDILINTQSTFATAPISIANLFDTNQYDGTNPDITVSNNVGISEYTNANFVSKATIFANPFPYPAASNMVGYKDPGTNGNYLRKVGAGDNIVHFLSTDSFYNKLPANYKGISMAFDEKVYADYAEKLLPRAIGYSAALMKYFFRGTLEISAPMKQVYSVISGTDNAFRTVKAQVKNATPNEAMGPGTLKAILKYKKRTDFSPDLVNDPPTASSREANFSFSASALYPVDSISSQVPTEVTFDFSQDPVPIGITDLYLMVVYKGTIGLETGTAVAAAGRDLMEPAHHVIFNLTDMFLLNNQLKLAGDIRSNPVYAAYVDLDHDGIFNEVGEGEPNIDPYNIHVDIGYSYATGSVVEPAVPAQTVATATIEPGKYIKLVCLVDNVTNTIIRFTQLPDVYPVANEKFFDVPEIVNQQFGSVWSASSQVSESRGIRNHFWQGGISCNNPVSDGACPDYPQNEAIPLSSTSPGPVTIFP